MALLFVDSFDHYVTADLLEKYATLSGATILAASGRRSSAALEFPGYYQSMKTRTFAPASATVVIGFAVRLAALPAGTTGLVWVNSGVSTQCSVVLNTAGTLLAYRGGPPSAGGTLLGTASGGLPAASYAFLEVQAVIHASAGSIRIRVNESDVLNLTGINTAATGAAAWDAVQFGDSNGPTIWRVDDLYILDGSGAAPLNTFLGDCRVDARYPTAEGASSAWTPLSGTDNALMVDETAPDDDTTYNSTSTVGATDTHVTQDAPVVGALLYGVQLVLSAKKSDAGTCSIAPVVRHSGVDYPGTAFNPGTSYAYNVTPYGTNPGTGAAWTEAGFNAIELGYKRTA